MTLILKYLSIILIKYLQNKYRSISLKHRYNQTNQIISKLILIQSILYYFKDQFKAWGYFHPDCIWTDKDEEYFIKLFPEKDFEEISLVILYNPGAVTYYRNKIFNLSKQRPPIYEMDIKKQLKEWKEWN